MKKVMGKLSLIIASVVCMIILFGCSSISSRAASVQKATDLQFTTRGIGYRPMSDGYYRVMIYREGANGGVIDYNNAFKCTSDLVGEFFEAQGESISESYNYLGKRTLYVITSSEPLSDKNKTPMDFKKDSKCVVAETSVTITQKMDKPRNVKIEEATFAGKKMYKVSWLPDGFYHTIDCKKTGEAPIYMNDYAYVPVNLVEDVIKIRTKTANYATHANSDLTVIKIATGEEVTEKEKEEEKPVEEEKKEEEKKEENSSEQGKASENDNKSSDTSKSAENSDNRNEPPKVTEAASLPANVIDGDITYSISADGKATVTGIGDVKKATLNEVIYSGVSYPVTTIAANAAKGNKKLTAVTIGSNVTKIDKKAFYNCKNLKKVTIKANKTITVSSSAFKKINKKASVSVKGIKGKAKKKLVDALKKQIGK